MSLWKKRERAPMVEVSPDDLAIWAIITATFIEREGLTPEKFGLRQAGVERPDVAAMAFGRAKALSGLARSGQKYLIRLED